MGYAPVTCPTTPTLEDLFYPNACTIAATARDLVEGEKTGWLPAERADLKSIEFKGPF
jgi:pyruvate dehydrogenase E1 component beta subunit